MVPRDSVEGERMAVGILAVASTVVATAGDASQVALLSVVSRWGADVLEGAYLEPVIR
jgi:hypothetical protein